MYAKIIDGKIKVFEICDCGHEAEVYFNVDDEQEFFKNVRDGKDSSYLEVDASASCNFPDCGGEMDWESGVKGLETVLKNPIPIYPLGKLIRR